MGGAGVLQTILSADSIVFEMELPRFLRRTACRLPDGSNKARAVFSQSLSSPWRAAHHVCTTREHRFRGKEKGRDSCFLQAARDLDG
ncbi:hypothetical protein MRX96_005599 [Rhipicephalus microplus]